MATSTILRVKRKIEENPQDALVLMCKRVKTNAEEVSPSLFVFQGTVDSQETTCVKSIVPKSELKLKSSHNVSDIIQKIRHERKEATQESRYKVVNCSRGLKDKTDIDSDLFDVVDLQKESDKESDVQYAYDLYVAAKQDDFDVSMLDNLVSIENYETTLILGSYRDNGLNAASGDEADDDDDSNDENNWRNDYPDTEDSSIDEEDMIRGMVRCEIEDNLSSDTGEDKIYNDLFKEDVKRYGAAYATYKIKVAAYDSQPPCGGLIQGVRVKEMDEESVDGYKDDKDDGFYYGQDEDTAGFREHYGDGSSDESSPD